MVTMAISQDVIVLNDWDGAAFSERRRTTSSGTKSRFTVSFYSEPLIANLDPVAIGKGVAEAMAKALGDGIRAITQKAEDSTIAKRVEAIGALARGARWATKRYSGGRTGSKPPNADGQGRLFNDSDRLAGGIFARPNRDGEWTVNVPANRFDPSTFNGKAADLVKMVERLKQLVPILADPAKLFALPAVAAAVVEAGGSVLTKARNAAEARLKVAMTSTFAALQDLGESASSLAGDE